MFSLPAVTELHSELKLKLKIQTHIRSMRTHESPFCYRVFRWFHHRPSGATGGICLQEAVVATTEKINTSDLEITQRAETMTQVFTPAD